MPVNTIASASLAAARTRSIAACCSAMPAEARRIASGWPAISLRKLSGNFPNDFTSRSGYRRMRADGRPSMKVAVIGGGSTYTPELVEGFGLRQGVLPVEELVLHDIDQHRLDDRRRPRRSGSSASSSSPAS